MRARPRPGRAPAARPGYVADSDGVCNDGVQVGNVEGEEVEGRDRTELSLVDIVGGPDLGADLRRFLVQCAVMVPMKEA